MHFVRERRINIHPQSGWYFIFGYNPNLYWQRTSAFLYWPASLAQPNIEYGMLSSRRLNNLKRKPNADGLVTYYYTSVEEPLGGRYYRKCDYYIIPVKVTPEVYAQLMKRDKKEHNNNHKHDRRYLDVEKYYRQHGEIDEDYRETNAWECVADKKTLNFENDIIEELDKQALLSTLSGSDRIFVKLYEAGVGQKSIAKAIGE